MCIVCSVLGSELTNGLVTVDEVYHGNQLVADNGSGALMNGEVTETSVVECDSFCDFVRFEGTVTEHCVPVNRSTGDDAGSAAFLRTCIEKYKSLFEALVAARILQCNQSLSSSFMDQFLSSEASATNNDKSKTDSKNASQAVVRHLEKVGLGALTKTAVESFSLACQLLVDFSALPIYTESTTSTPTDNVPGKNADYEKEFSHSKMIAIRLRLCVCNEDSCSCTFYM